MVIFMGLVGVVFLVVVARLGHLQLIAGASYRRQAAAALRSIELLPTRRGEILDRKGRILALDNPCYQFCLDYRFLTRDAKYVLRQKRRIALRNGVSMLRAAEIYRDRQARTWRLAAHIGDVSPQELRDRAQSIIRRVRRIRDIVGTDVREQFQTHPVLVGLDEAAATQFEAKLDDMIGAQVRPGHMRWYPRGETACHVIGLTGEVGSEDLRRKGSRGETLSERLDEYLAGDTIGRMGIEKSCEAFLRGQRGYRKLKRRVGKAPEVLEQRLGEPGGTVRLAIDIELQEILTQLFCELTAQRNAVTGSWRGARPSNGAAAVVSIPEGDVLALVSIPTYDLNTYGKRFDELRDASVELPLLNRAVTRRYPIGSTAKPITAVAGLETRLQPPITPQTRFTCHGRIRVGNTHLHCWTHSHGMPGHGALDLVGALMHSCNVYFYSVGRRVGLEQLCQWFARFGFARPPVASLPAAVSGHVPTRRWLAQHKPGYRVARPFDACQVAIGQGFLGATPLHVASAMATIARGGVVVTPRLVLRGPTFERHQEDLGVPAAHMTAIQRGLYKVVNERGGTAYKAFHVTGTPISGVDVYGKTGTSTATPPDLNGDNRLDARERRLKEMSWFAGFAVPRSGGSVTGRRGVSVAVVVEYTTGGGSRNAAPVAREAIRACREMGYIPDP
ncbi:MAG: hypothetical protein KGY99_01495 [Phycisphaerae bacterium]|nr:hypothetical protein [Phycisphaerae bacterium]